MTDSYLYGLCGAKLPPGVRFTVDGPSERARVTLYGATVEQAAYLEAEIARVLPPWWRTTVVRYEDTPPSMTA